MEERLINQVVGQVMVYDSAARQWHPAGTSSGLSTVKLIHCLSNDTFRIHGQKINELREVVLDSQITREVKYNRANEAFIQWHDSQAFWGLNFRRGSPDAESFFASVVTVLKILNQNAAQQQSNQAMPADLASNHQQVQQVQQQQPPVQNSAAIIQRSLQQQQVTQQTLLHQQQQAQIITQQQTHAAMLNQGPPTQVIQPPQQQQPSQHMLQQQQQQQQQQQLHQHYMHQQQPQTQSHQTNHNQINHYQHMQQQQQQPPPPQPQQQMQPQVAPVVAAPIPPPPPPPPAPPALLNNNRVNGTVNSIANNSASLPVSNASNNSQHSPSINSSNGNQNHVQTERNGGSPNQASSLASELAKCQLRKVNLSRSDSEKESECNNNNVGNPKTIRAASIAHVTDNLMNDLNKKLASRRERLDQQGDNQQNSNSSIANGINSDKSQESWLVELIRKEISKEISRAKVEIIDAIKTELRQR